MLRRLTGGAREPDTAAGDRVWTSRALLKCNCGVTVSLLGLWPVCDLMYCPGLLLKINQAPKYIIQRVKRSIRYSFVSMLRIERTATPLARVQNGGGQEARASACAAHSLRSDRRALAAWQV